VPERVTPVFALEELRELAGDDGPTELRAARIVAGTMRDAIARHGGDWSVRSTPVYALEAVYPDRSVLIEPAGDLACTRDFVPAVWDDPAAYERMQQAMLRADLILATHEHYDHICGLTRSPYFDRIAPKARLTRAQLAAPSAISSLDDRARETLVPMDPRPLHPIAPGIVLVAAPGHTPGSQWIYIRERSGAEWLLVGDTLWTHDALTTMVTKPWLWILIGREDADEQARYVRFLADLEAAHPELRVMVAHDEAQWMEALSSGALAPL
jgi:glyoxylase-like metal-dependent hydrolase (beta-lactamase superfamily II)